MRQVWSLATGVLAVLTIATVNAPGLQAQELNPRADSSASADTLVLSLAETQRLALQRSPAFLADRQEEAIARGELRQARAYTLNPTVDIEGFETGAPGSPRQYTAALSQEIQWAGQWGLRAGAARAGLVRAESRVRDAARATVAEASRAYYAALAADRRLVVAEQIFGANERLRQATQVQLREGEISTLEGNLAQIEFGRSRARVLTARRETTSALIELRRAVGLPPEQPVRLTEDLPQLPGTTELTEDSLVTLALSRRPDLAAQTAAVQQSETLGRLARREAIPNLRISALATRDAGEGASRFGIGVGLPLPLWNRNRGLVAQREAEIEQAVLRRRDVELRVRAEVTDAYRTYVAASEEARTLEATVLEPARQNQTLLESAFRAGKIGLPTVLLLRNQLLDAELDYWSSWLAHRDAAVRLEAAVAEPLTVPAPGTTDETKRENDR